MDGTQDWLQAIGSASGIAQDKIDQARNIAKSQMEGLLASKPIKGRITLSGYEGSELLVGRLLVECGADLRYVGSACPATPWNQLDAEWLRAHGVQVQFRASLEQDMQAVHEYKPQLAIGTTPIVQKAKQLSIPSLYFTNLISARPLMGVAGAGSLVQVIQSALGNQHRFDAMSDFFGPVGKGYASGVWESVPQDRPEFKAETRRQLERLMKKRKAEEMGG
jgi:chlorophyllide a reductase subunit Y